MRQASRSRKYEPQQIARRDCCVGSKAVHARRGLKIDHQSNGHYRNLFGLNAYTSNQASTSHRSKNLIGNTFHARFEAIVSQCPIWRDIRTINSLDCKACDAYLCSGRSDVSSDQMCGIWSVKTDPTVMCYRTDGSERDGCDQFP
jgi:hypothetical protein